MSMIMTGGEIVGWLVVIQLSFRFSRDDSIGEVHLPLCQVTFMVHLWPTSPSLVMGV